MANFNLENRNKAIAARVAAGETTDTIAADFDLSRVRVSQIAKAAGVNVGRGGNCPDRRGARNPRWKAAKLARGDGYIATTDPDCGGIQYEHIRVAERALGKPLPAGAVVHHVNGNRTDNRPENLVICEDHAYHMLLHKRARQLGVNRASV